MRISESSKVPEDFHCETCGADYQSTTYQNERGDGQVDIRPDREHRCPLYYGEFYIMQDVAYRRVEGKLYSREVVRRVSDQGNLGQSLYEGLWTLVPSSSGLPQNQFVTRGGKPFKV